MAALAWEIHRLFVEASRYAAYHIGIASVYWFGTARDSVSLASFAKSCGYGQSPAVPVLFARHWKTAGSFTLHGS